MRHLNIKSRFLILLLGLLTLSISQAWGENYTYSKVTSAPTDWSGTYILVYENGTSARICVGGTDEASNYTEGTISNSTITGDFSANEVEIATYSTGYSIKALGGTNKGKFLEGKGSSSNGTTFANSASKVTTLSISDGVVTITNNSNVFAYNSASGNLRWRFFKSSTASGNGYYKPAFYKKDVSEKTDVSLNIGSNGSLMAYSDEDCTSEITISNNEISVDQNSTVYFKATPNTGFVVDSWTGATADPSDNTKASLAVGTTKATVSVSFKTPASHDIYWYANGQQVAKNSQQEGATLTIPADPDPAIYCDGKTFIGWTAASTVATDGTGITYVKAGDKVDATDKYYAVFADASSGGGSTTSVCDFEQETNDDWTIDKAITRTASQGTGSPASYAGQINTNNTYVTFKEKVKVEEFGFSFKRTSTNSNYNVYVETSTDNSNWSAHATYNMSDFGNGSYTSKNDDTFDGKTALYVRFHCYNTTAIRYVDDISITYAGGTTYSNYTTSCCTKHEVKKGTMTIGGFTATPTQACAGVEITLVPDEVTGYNFTGWTSSPNVTITNNKFSMLDEDVTITANYEAISYQISYNLDGGAWNGAEGVKTYTYGTGVPTLPTNVEKANNTFLGWYVSNPAEIVTSIGTTETGDKSFIASWLPSEARAVAYSGNDQLNYISNPQNVDKDDLSLTVTYSVNKGYTISAVAVTVDGSALTESEVVFSDEQLTITPTDGFTGNVAITFTVVEKKFTVTWMANKTQFKQVQIQEGSKVTLPAETPSDVISGEDTYKFQGWTTAEYNNDNIAPAYITNNTIEPTGDVTYYAVYAKVTPGPVSNDYAKITATTDLVEDGQYIIASGTKALNSDVYSSYYLTATGVTISNNKITTTNAKLVWTIDDNDEGDVLFKSNDNGNYLQIIDAGSGHYNLVANSDEDGDHAYFTPSVSSGNWTLKSYTYKSYYVSYNSNYNEFTANTSASNLQLYKRQNNPDTYKNYRTRVAIIDHIAVNGTPAETKFVAGETFDATGLSIDVYYQGEDNPTNVTTGFTYAPNGTLATSNDKITFTYQGKTADVAISVSNTVSGIEVTNNPTKMEYTEGEQFNPEGMEVTATYDNEAKRVVTGYDYEPKGDLALGNKITISFGGQTTELGITINEATKTTVNWFVEGVKLTEGGQSTAVIPGKKITVLPTEPEACQGNQFVGWTTQETYYNATTAPTDLFKTLADAPVVGESETNYYAVFASEAVGTYDEKVTLTALDAPTADKFTYAFAKNSGTQPAWVSGEARAYVNNTLTITSKNDRIITKIEYTYNINKNKNDIAPDNATVTGNNSDNGSWDATNKTWTSSTNAATTVTLTVNGSAGNYGFTAIKVYLTGGTVLSDYSTTCLAALANPTIITAEGEYCGSVDVEITQPAGNPDDAKIMYSTDNETWKEYSAAVNITTSGTVYAKVVKDPKSTEVVSATYTVYPAYTLAQAATAASATSQIACLTFTDLLVQARSQSEAFLKASDGQIVLLNKSSHGLQVGDKLVANDAHVTFVKAHDLLQLTSIEGVEKPSTGNATTPEVKAITDLVATDYGQLVKIMNVTYDATNKKFTDASSNEIAIDAKFFVGGSLPSWPNGGKFNATGVVVLDNNSNAVIAPRNTEDLESLATPLDAPTDFAVTSVNSYRASYSWTTVDNNVGYTLYIYDGATEIYKSNKIGSTIETYAPQKDLEAGHTYTAKLVALGDKAISSDSPAAEVEFTTNPNAKLNWYVGDDEEPYATTYASQEKVVTPEDPESPCATNYENFVTWYTEEIVSETGQISALEASKKVKAGDAAASQVGSAKEYNFYAVFGKIKTAGTDKYVKVTSEPTKWEGEYLIVHNDSVFDGSQTTLDAEKNGVVLTKEEDGSYLASNANNYRFVIAKSTTKDEDDETAVYYTIQSASEYYIGGKDGSNGMNSNQKFATQTYDNILSWSEDKVEISSYYGNTYLTFNTASDQLRFRYMKSTSYNQNLVLYKREKTNPQYAGYITTCPQTYTITIANNTKGLVEAATTTEILKGAKVLLTATAYDGYTKTGGAWVVKKTATSEVVDELVGNTNFLTMPDYNVTVDYDFQEIKDQFVDNLHGNTTIEKGGANYELPVLADFSETTGKPSDAFTKFIGWSATSYDSGEPATEQPTILEGNQTATGATYFAVWHNQSSKYITEYCQTAVPTNLHLVAEYHKATSVRIDWNSVDGADKYHIIVMDGDAEIIADADVTESLYDLSGLTPGATYICTVKAHKDCWSDETEEFEFTTKENIQSYAVTINAEGGTYTIDPELEDGKIQEGKTVTISNIAVTDATTHFFKELTVPEATDLTEVEGDYTFTMPGKAVTINIVFAEYPKVTWKMEGQADVVTSSVRQDNKFVVGTVQPAPENWKYKNHFTEFAGWMTNDDVENPEFVTTTTEVPADGLVVNGAIATKETKQYQLVTDVANLAANDELVIVGLKTSNSQYYAAGEIPSTKDYLNAVEIGAPENNIITVESEDVLVFTLGGTTDAWTFNANGKYLSSTGTKANKWDGDYKTWKLSNSSTANMVVMTSVQYTSGKFEFNMGDPRFRNYEGSCAALYFYRYSGSIYSNLTIDPQPDHVRTGLTYDKAGTICLPYAVKAEDYKGASIWSIESRTGSEDLITSITLVEEVDNKGNKKDLVAGKPYIFFAEESEFALFYSGEEYTGNTSVWANGLIGNLNVDDIVINAGGYQPGSYLINQNKLMECGADCYVGQYRAYVKAAQIGAGEPLQAPVMAPRRVIGNPNVAPTRIDSLNEDAWVNMNGAHKYFLNGNIVILNEGQLYNAQGIEIK